jgi:ABC-2 type transport system ATP-binding protein
VSSDDSVADEAEHAMTELASPLAQEHSGVASSPCAVDAAGLTKRYGDKVAVDRLDLRIERGEIFGLLGPNGAGKTTTILMLLGLTEPTDGHARVDGLDPTRDALAIKQRVGYLPDDVGFYDELTGRQNLRYTAMLNRLSVREADARVDEVMQQVGLADVADRKTKSYSRGMRQRLGLADALVKRPSMLILDEPTVNIDPEGVRETLQLIARLRAENGVTVLLSSHLLHQVEQICDRIGIFVGGRLVAVGTVETLAQQLEGRWTFTVDADDPAGHVPDALERIHGVRSIEPGPEGWRIVADTDIRPAIVAAVGAAGATLTHLARSRADLDAIYHRYFSGAHQ